jgi:uncharacterized protein (TIGR02246 family)
MLSSSSENDRRSSSHIGICSLALALATVMLVGCQPQNGGQTTEAALNTAEVEATLDSLRQTFVQAWEAGDAQTIGSMWAEDGLQAVAGEPPIHGRDTIQAAYEAFFSATEGTPEVTIDSVYDMQVMGDEWAYEYATLSYRAPLAGSDSVQTGRSTYLLIYRRTPEGWKTYRESISANGPPPDAEWEGQT